MRLLVPVDGSPPSHRAVLHAASLAGGRSDAEVILVNVQNRATLGLSDIAAGPSPDVEAKIARHASDKLFRREIRACKDAQAAFETVAETGPIAETIARLARELDASQIIMGTRGMSAVGDLLLGSVATRTVHLAEVPVTLVK